LNTLLYLTFLQKQTKSTPDDQADTLAVNFGSPPTLFFSLLSLGLTLRFKVLSSVVFFAFFATATLLLPVYGVSVFTIGALFSDTPIPVTLGTCGQRNVSHSAISSTQQWEEYKVSQIHQTRAFSMLESHISGCI